MKHLKWFIDKDWDLGDCPKLGSKVRIDDGRPFLNDLFRDEGILEILDAKDIKDLEHILPFIGAIVDQAHWESKDATVT